MKRAVLFSLLLFLLAGCGGVKDSVSDLFGADKDLAEPPAPLVEFRARINVVELWSEATGSGTDEQYLKLRPVVANQRVFTVDTKGRLAAMDATNGRKLWTARMKATEQIDDGPFWQRGARVQISGGPGYGENMVMVGTNEGRVLAYSAEDGAERWRAQVSSEVLSAPQKSNQVVVVRTIDGKIFGLDGRRGRRLWIYDRSVPSLTLRGTSTPVIDKDSGIVIAGFDGGRLAAVELNTGRLLWEARVAAARGSSELEKMVDIDGAPIIIDDVIYVASFQGNLAAVQLQTGRLIWSENISTHAKISGDESYIYVSDENSDIAAFDRYTGTRAWKSEKLHARAATGPALIGEYLVVGDFKGYLHWMDKASGRFVARQRLCRERIIAAPIVAGKMLYAYCSNGELAAYTYR